MGNLIQQWSNILEAEKALKEQKDELREKILEEVSGGILPVITVDVPEEYFLTTGQTYDEFLASRFPDWTLEDITADEIVTFTLKKIEKYQGGVMEIPGSDRALTKTIVEYSPEIDMDTLMLEDPDLFDRLFQQKVTWEIDEQALEQEVVSNPDIFSVLRRHSKVKTPTVKILVKKVKDE